MHKIDLDINRIVDMYMSGKSSVAIGKEMGVSKTVIRNRLKSAGVNMRDSRLPINLNEVASAYVSGMSENAVAKQFGCSRNAIRRVLVDAGVHVRTQSEAEALKWQSMPPEKRAKQVSSAHDAIRNKPPEFHEASSILQAKAKERSLAKVGHMELEFQKAFEARGFTVTPQKAVGPYNIDLAINRTAVEIHANSCHPHTHAYYSQRVMNLLECGWNVVYIKTLSNVSIEWAADQVSRMIHLIQSNKPSVCQYGVVNGSGQLMASGCLDGDKLAIVDAANGFFA